MNSQLDAPARLESFAQFCAHLRLENGDPFELEDFQHRMLFDYFAGITETLVMLPKKNGKTTLLGALALHHLITTADAECVIGAATRDQAGILFKQASGFVRRSPGLAVHADLKPGYREIRNKADAGVIRVLASDVDGADGVIPTLALVDELHRHRNAGLYGVFRDGLGPRDGQMLTISTAGDNEAGTLGVLRTSARHLPLVVTRLDGRYTYARSADSSFAMHEWSLKDADDVHDMQLVKLVNPLASQTVEKLRARHDSPSMLPWQWLRFACGIWAAGEAWWMVPDVWQANAVAEQLADGDHVALGFDGARYGDATALVACRIDDGLLQLLHVWEAPTTPAPANWEVPAGEVDRALNAAMGRFKVARGYFDPPLWQSEIDGWAHEYGETQVMRFWTARTRMMHAVERFRTDNVAGEVPHVPNPVLDKHVLNAQAKEVRGGYWLTRRSEREKIDAAVASVLAYEARCDVLQADERPAQAAFL